MNWTELTAEKVDELDGTESSYYVAQAMGHELVQVNFSMWEWCIKNPTGYGAELIPWRPHDDANQALEVFYALLDIEQYAMVELVANGAVVTTWRRGLKEDGIHRPLELARSDFHTAILRAYLKVRLEDETE